GRRADVGVGAGSAGGPVHREEGSAEGRAAHRRSVHGGPGRLDAHRGVHRLRPPPGHRRPQGGTVTGRAATPATGTGPRPWSPRSGRSRSMCRGTGTPRSSRRSSVSGSVHPVIFIDAINVKIRDGQVANRPIYVAPAVTAGGRRDILGLWAGDGGEGAKYWLQVLTEILNRGVADVCMVVCDGLSGLPDAIETVWPRALTRTCVIHLLRNTFRHAARQHWDAVAK